MKPADSSSEPDAIRHAIKVVAGVIWHPANQSNITHDASAFLAARNKTDRILLALRQQHQHQGGLWEFPGGKVDAGESGFEALKRELIEEIAIDVVQANPWFQVSHDYPDKSVDLEFWHVTQFKGEPSGCEQQQLRWVELAEIGSYQFPKANQSAVDALVC